MLRASLELSAGDLELAECFLFEAEQAVWNLYEDKKSGAWTIRGFFQDEESRSAGVAELTNYFEPFASVLLDEVVDQDWQNAYKEFLDPWSFERLHWVPIWQKEEYLVPADHVALYYDADMAFGTGSHETTRLCGEGLYQYIQQAKANLADKKILDAGCGSGILAISALLLGASNLHAFDIDPETMRVCEENLVRNNRASEDVNFFVGDLESGLPADQSVDLLLANIQTHILVPYLERFLLSLSSEGTIVFSGILAEEEDAFTSALMATCHELCLNEACQTKVMGEWISVTWHNW